MSDIKEWYYGVPPITRFLFTASFGLTVIANFYKPLMPKLLLDSHFIWHDFEIWRLASSYFFYGGLGFPFLINMMFLYQYSRLLEEETYTGKPAEYVWMLLVCAGVLLPVGLLWPFPVLSISLLLAIVYVWANLNKERQVSFFFGLRFKAMYFPWVLMCFNLLMGGFPLLELVGIVAGHAYYFLQYVYPETNGRTIINCPEFIEIMKYHNYPIILIATALLYLATHAPPWCSLLTLLFTTPCSRKRFPDQRLVAGMTGSYARGPTFEERAQARNQANRGHGWGTGHRLG